MTNSIPKCLALDFDGVLTDNGVYTDNKGNELVRTSKLDSLGLSMIRGLLSVVVISSEKSKHVDERCKKLKIDCFSGVEDKVQVLSSYISGKSIKPEECWFVGNDVNDIDLANFCGLSIGVADAHPIFLKTVDLVTNSKGGNGAVREISDQIMGIYYG